VCGVNGYYALQAFAALFLCVCYLAHPEPGSHVLWIGAQDLSQEARTRGAISILNGVDGLIKDVLGVCHCVYQHRPMAGESRETLEIASRVL
jgi:hypothetical protein